MIFLSWPPLGGSRFLSLLILQTQCLHLLEPSGCFANDFRVEVIRRSQILQRNNQGIRDFLIVRNTPPREKFEPYLPIARAEAGELIAEVAAGIPFSAFLADRWIIGNIFAVAVQAVDRCRNVGRYIFIAFASVSRRACDAGNGYAQLLLTTFQTKIGYACRNEKLDALFLQPVHGSRMDE